MLDGYRQVGATFHFQCKDAAFFPADHLGRLIDMPLPSATQYYTWAERMERSPLTDSYIFRSTSPARLSFESPLLEPSPSSRIRPSSPRAMSPTRRSSPFMEPLSPMSPVTPLPDYLQPNSRPPRHFGSRDWESKDWKRSPSPARRHYLSELSTQDPGLSSFERSLADTYVSSPAARIRNCFRAPALLVFSQEATKARRPGCYQLRCPILHGLRVRCLQAPLTMSSSRNLSTILSLSLSFLPQAFLLLHPLVLLHLWEVRCHVALYTSWTRMLLDSKTQNPTHKVQEYFPALLPKEQRAVQQTLACRMSSTRQRIADFGQS